MTTQTDNRQCGCLAYDARECFDLRNYGFYPAYRSPQDGDGTDEECPCPCHHEHDIAVNELAENMLLAGQIEEKNLPLVMNRYLALPDDELAERLEISRTLRSLSLQYHIRESRN